MSISMPLLIHIGLVNSTFVCSSDGFNIEKFLNSSPAELRKQKQKYDTLEKTRKLKLTTSEAQLFLFRSCRESTQVTG